MTAKRLNYPDMAKGIGIILVVVGHSCLCGAGLLAWLSHFHMPLFFMILGMLLSHRQEEACPLTQSARRKARSIMLPYFAFSLIYLLIEFFRMIWRHQEFSLSDAVLQTVSFYGISVLWFLPTLYAGELLFLFIRKKEDTFSRSSRAVSSFPPAFSVEISTSHIITRHPSLSFPSGSAT